MASTKTAESGGEVVRGAYKKRFVFAPRSATAGPGDPATGNYLQVSGALMSPRAAIGGVCMGAAALLCFIVAGGLSGGGSEVSATTAQHVEQLQSRIQQVETQADGLPDAKDADRGLVTALSSADDVAQLQNDYRSLTPAVAAAGGELDERSTESTRQNLTPYFAPSVNQSALEPWYLLAGDKDIPAGIGIPMSFDSGFHWVAQRPYTINDDSTVPVTWLAVQTRPAKGQTAEVLAWTRADFDLTRQTFTNVRTGTTGTGEALRLEVRQR